MQELISHYSITVSVSQKLYISLYFQKLSTFPLILDSPAVCHPHVPFVLTFLVSMRYLAQVCVQRYLVWCCYPVKIVVGQNLIDNDVRGREMMSCCYKIWNLRPND